MGDKNASYEENCIIFGFFPDFWPKDGKNQRILLMFHCKLGELHTFHPKKKDKQREGEKKSGRKKNRRWQDLD